MSEKVAVTCPHCGQTFPYVVTMPDYSPGAQCPHCHKTLHLDIRKWNVATVRK